MNELKKLNKKRVAQNVGRLIASLRAPWEWVCCPSVLSDPWGVQQLGKKGKKENR